MRYFILLFCFLFNTLTFAMDLKPNAPARYVVQPGDSLWSIACRYLVHPWEWRELWRANPKIKNPNHIYAGAVLVLDYYKSNPYIRVLSNGTVKLSPSTRLEPLDDVIPPIPLGHIKPFLNESLVLDEDILTRGPYVIALMGERLRGGQGDEVYVKGLHPSKEMPQGGTIAYSLFRKGKILIDPATKAILGYYATLVGFGELVAGGEPAVIMLTSINEGIRKDDKVLINNSPEFNLEFEPQTPTVKISGLILDMPSGMHMGHSQAAVGQVIVISKGAADGLNPGDVLGLYGKVRVVKDPHNSFRAIALPPERLGEAMVFRTFTKTSFALIVRSIRAVYLGDTVTNP
ncbi:MAG: LysM peptidoglycan-binding domain-containing protein [Legionella sp.]|nr:MAG: LysM peptidoglycan-binding domain-containing protein [Legionella sp.]